MKKIVTLKISNPRPDGYDCSLIHISGTFDYPSLIAEIVRQLYCRVQEIEIIGENEN